MGKQATFCSVQQTGSRLWGCEMPQCFGSAVLGSMPSYMSTILSGVAGVGVFFACFGPGPASSGSLERLVTLFLALWIASGVSEGTDLEESELDVREK